MLNIIKLSLIGSVLLLVGCNSPDFADELYYHEGTVAQVGTCRGTYDSSSRDYQCSITVITNGSIEYGTTTSPILEGQPIYKECWTKDKSNYCYTDWQTSVRNKFMKGGSK